MRRLFVDHAIKRIERWNKQDRAEFKKVFGSTMYRNRALRGFKAIRKTLDNKIYWSQSSGGKAGWLASVIPGGKVDITFYPGFSTLPRYGFQSRAGVIVHELSHEVLDTKDFRKVYGLTKVKALANGNPGKAIRCAEAYAAYAMRAAR